MTKTTLWQKYQIHLETAFIFLLAAAVRLTSLNVFRVVDEEDRWRWAVEFYRALLAGDLAATLVGDGYPGIFPVWLESGWLFLASLYRSALQGGWIGEDGVYLLIHQWDRTDNLWLQRFPVVFVNTLLVVIIFLYLRRLFGRWVALLSAILISLDPFYLSDSRVNRAEALVTGLMFVSLLAFITAFQAKQQESKTIVLDSKRHRSQKVHFLTPTNLFTNLLISALFGGLAWLTKSQALVLIPVFGVISFIWQARLIGEWPVALRRWLAIMGVWVLIATLTFALLWPAVWTVPAATFTLMSNFITRKVGEEGVKLFFLGQTILDEDPGLLFYPVIFLLRATPLMLLGLALAVWGYVRYQLPFTNYKNRRAWLDNAGVWALLAYVLLYTAGMSLGSHKQDRFLMTIFPALDVLAAMGFVGLAQLKSWSVQKKWAGVGVLLAAQFITTLPYHPYYFSYFNPLIGGGPVATRLTRVGWGEGMDQVGAYLQSLDDPRSLVVASRFSGYLLGFKGQTLNLDDDGEWVRADKIVFYIQQSQRMLDPSPGLIRYFQQHIPPEKVVVINGLEYAQVYPNPIQFPANPQTDAIESTMRLFGYRWEPQPDGAVLLRLIWENLAAGTLSIGTRLSLNSDTQSDWLTCAVAPGFETVAQTPGEVVESECHLAQFDLPPGLYNLQIGIWPGDGAWLPLEFAAGRSAIEITGDSNLRRIEPEAAFARLAAAAVPGYATPVEHTYFDRIRLLAYDMVPPEPQPGQSMSVRLYWQAQRVLEQDVHVSVQAFVGDQRVALVNGPPLSGRGARPTSTWRPGEVIADAYAFEIPPDMPAPAVLRLDVGLYLPDTLKTLPIRNLAGEDIPGAVAEIRVIPPAWPAYRGEHPLNFTLGEIIQLTGYELEEQPDNLLDVTLYWQAIDSPQESYTAFVHLLNAEGALIAQSDVIPARGYFPTSTWRPGDVVLSYHGLALPPNSQLDGYTIVAGLYNAVDGTRLPVFDSDNKLLADNVAPIKQP
jgi:4-amino-4-deoxy-L-arabinose transferase-like glycosyltransferase